ncbi:Jouberin [Melipona quadrifasciata]|uniref:Jouberin n=1 Tax=Melipona quadrifasciata TaxID=166423 RepID=A0A0M8ZRC8_9HYME|nr:Jouberin [Melipona quadrifasciata]
MNSSEFTSKSMDVVVDIHQECEKEKLHSDNVEQDESLNKRNSFLTECRNAKAFLKTNTIRERKIDRSKVNSKHQNFPRDDDDIKVVDSLDLIEEFREPLIEREDRKKIQSATSNKSSKKNINRLPAEGKSHGRKQWFKSKDEIEEVRKPMRKRWSKDNTVIRLPEARSSSWTIISPESASSKLVHQRPEKPSSKKTLSGLDNEAFDSEEILTIETDYNRDNPKIKMIHGVEELELSTLDSRSLRDSLSDENKCFKETAITIEDFNESVNSERSESQRKNATSDTERVDNFNHDDVSLKSGTNCGLISKRKNFVEKNDKEHRSQRKDREKRFCKSASAHTPSINAEEDSKRKKKRKKKNNVKYISVTIHRTDTLEIDYVTKHPMVKVHIVKAENGKYLKSEHGASTYLQPIITGKFDFKENKSIVPVWEEELIFENDFKEILKIDNEQVVILFEIVDLLSFAEASFNYDKFGKFRHEACWYKVAWAFLKPVGRNQVLHIDKKVRLQLYRPRKNSHKFDRFHTSEVYTWWKSNVREKYPSSLFVTVKSIDPPKLESVFYRQLSLRDVSNIRNESQTIPVQTSDSINLPKWTRLAAQSCKIPNEIFFETDIGENGCFYVAYSNNGKYLACCFSEEHDYPIIVYEVEAKKIHVRLSGHKTFVYCFNWSNNDNYLLSVSSDQTARIWDIQNQIVEHIEMLPHPSYVYCGKFDPENSSIVATGCYDRIARIWMRNKKLKNWNLSQELEGHEGFVNAMYFQKNSNLLTADSVGIIIIWMLKKNRKISSKKEWHISRKIKVREIDGIIINTIILHPLESRLLVHSRDNGLKILDLATGVVLQKYNELNNQRIQSTACISPCGNLIFCGGEDSSLNVWNLETGNLLARYTFDRHYRAVTCVDYHPYDHVLAFSTFGSPAPVRILRFNKDATGENIGLKMMGTIENAVNNNDVSMRFLNASKEMSKEKPRSSNMKKIIEEASQFCGNLQSSQSYNSSFLKLSDNVLLENDKYNDTMCNNTKTKLQLLNETGQTMKSRSANRLYNIIEKIDRILSNTSKSSGDIESGRNFVLLQESSESKLLTSLNENIEKQKKKLRKNKSAYSSIVDKSSSYIESSATNSDKLKVVECYTIQNERLNDWNMKKRSKSAKEIRSSNIFKDDISKTFSDSATNYQKIKVHHEVTKISPQKNIEPDFTIKENDKKSITYRKNSLIKKDDSDSTDSTGTYIVEKNNIKDNDKDLMKMFENKNLNSTESKANVKHSESDSSIPSNATFIIENEISISKPKKNSLV